MRMAMACMSRKLCRDSSPEAAQMKGWGWMMTANRVYVQEQSAAFLGRWCGWEGNMDTLYMKETFVSLYIDRLFRSGLGWIGVERKEKQRKEKKGKTELDLLYILLGCNGTSLSPFTFTFAFPRKWQWSVVDAVSSLLFQHARTRFGTRNQLHVIGFLSCMSSWLTSFFLFLFIPIIRLYQSINQLINPSPAATHPRKHLPFPEPIYLNPR